MKKMTRMMLALLLALALLAPAFAVLAEEITPEQALTMWVNVKKVKVYAERNVKSKVLTKLKGGTQILVETMTSDGAWYSTLVEDTKHGGQQLGWIQGESLIDYFPQSFCKHDWSEWTVEREPSCTEKGYRYRFCNICGIRDEEETKKLKHDFTKWKVLKEATCSKKGERVRTCEVCGYEEKEEYYDEHTFGSWSLVKEPTCSSKGERARTCKVCGKEERQELDKLAHDYAWTVTVEATDHSAGVRSKVCRACGYNGGEESFDPEGTLRRKDRGEEVYAMQQLLVEQGYLNVGGADGIFGGGTEKALMQYQKDRGLNPDGIGWPQTLKDLQHDFGPWETLKEMSRTEAGERVRVCRGCGFEQHETVQAGTVIERGRRGEDVRALQQIIKEVGFDAGSFDGIYGKKLDAAMAGFAAANNLVVEEGKIRPADVDAVVNAWFDALPAETWMGEGNMDSPVNLALSVVADAQGEGAEGVNTYRWSLTNLGTEKAMFNLLMLSFGDAPDFTRDNLVMVIDGIELMPGAANSASGRFTATSDWGEGNLNFAAMAVSEATGAKWLSNAVVFENAEAEEEQVAKTIEPDLVSIDVNNLPDGIYPVAFDRGDVLSGASGIYMNAVRIYSQDHYDLVDVSTLAVGDTIIAEGEEVPVLTLEAGENYFIVNEDQDARSFWLVNEEDTNGYVIRGLSDLSTYTELGTTTLTLDPAAIYTDSSDIESEPATFAYDEIVGAMQAFEFNYYVPYNTTVRIESGKVVEINRVYVP